MPDIVLIADDDQAVLTMLYKVVRSNGIEADTAASGEEALALLEQKPYDLLLLDVNMHGMDGFQVVQAIRRRGLKLPIIIVSGRKEDYDTLYGLDIGADDYVTKPFNPVTLGAKVKALIRRSRNHLPGVDSVIAAQAPKLSPYREAMRENLAAAMGVPVENVGVKATTTEHLGHEGREEGITAYATCLVCRI